MCPSSGLWGGHELWFPVYHRPLSFDGPQLWPSMSVCSSLHLFTRAHCAWCFPSIPMWLASYLLAPAGGRTKAPECALQKPVWHDQRRFFFPLFLYIKLSFLYIKLFELGVEVAFSNWSAVTHHNVNLLKFPLWSSCSERTNDDFVLLICFCFFHL